MKTTKQQRLEHANALIQVISQHGRRFFFHGGVRVFDKHTQTTVFVPANRHARLELRNGRVYFIDDYTEKAVYTHPAYFGNRWRGFSHGGTLRALVEDMRDYVMTGQRIARWKIAPARWREEDGDIWGYGTEAAAAVRAAAFELPIMEEAAHAA